MIERKQEHSFKLVWETDSSRLSTAKVLQNPQLMI